VIPWGRRKRTAKLRWVSTCGFAALLLHCGSNDGPDATPNPGDDRDAEAGVADATIDARSGDASADRHDATGPGDGSSAGDADAATDGPSMQDASDAATGLEQSEPYKTVVYPPENPHSEAKAVLGKILFWDEQLGSKNDMACGTCHRAEAGGSDPRAGQPASLGPGPDKTFGTADDARGGRGLARCDEHGDPVDDPVFHFANQITARKPPTYLDAWYFTDLFWDGRATSKFTLPGTTTVAVAAGGALESQAAGPPLEPSEMACQSRTWADVVTKLETAVPLALATQIPVDIEKALASAPTYPLLFQAAFGSPTIDVKGILFAIATHERRLTSKETPWDRYNAGELTALTPSQVRGLALFNTKALCNKCHAPPMFTDDKFHNIGFTDPALDKGRELITQDAADRGKVKTPSLRNVGLREAGGLLHNGMGNGVSLQTVLTAYNKGGVVTTNLDPLMKPLKLTNEDLDALLDFLRNGLTDPRVKDAEPPFDHPRLSTE
jgi:cytochrome c peroxidase